MSGQDILIEQLRAEVERLRDDRADLQERCNRLTGERNAALLLMKDEEARAEKAERFIATADSEWKARAEKAERERDEWKARHDTLADVSRKCIATTERERDARPDISAEDARAFMMFKPVPARDSREGPVMHALRAHAAKARVVPRGDGGRDRAVAPVGYAAGHPASHRRRPGGPMTREQMEMDAEVLMYLSTRVKTGPEANAVERALNNLLARLARMDGPPPGHVRATIKADAGPGPGEWYVPRQSESTRPYEGDQMIEQLRADVERLTAERDEAIAERDARPDISAEDAAHAVQFFRGWDAPGSVTDKVFAALRAHAAKAVNP